MLFTKQEKNIIWFLVVTLLVGTIWLLVKKFVFEQKPVDLGYISQDEVPIEKTSEVADVVVEENDKKVNINTATFADIEALPYLGDVKATAIIEYRKKHGAFSSIDDLVKVKGIGEKLLEKVKKYIEI